jgi:energy-coupling factor transport system permease protein
MSDRVGARPEPDEQTTGTGDWRRDERRGWTTRDALLVAVLGVIFAFLYMQWIPVWLAARAFGAQVGQEALFGFWLTAGVLAAYIVRRPGAALVGEFLAAFAQVLIGAPAGAPLLITGIMQGIGAELVFASRGYRDWRLRTLLVAGMVTALIALPWNWFRLGYFALDPAFLAVLLVVRIASGAFWAGLVPKILGDLLARTGVLSGYAIGRQREQPRV